MSEKRPDGHYWVRPKHFLEPIPGYWRGGLGVFHVDGCVFQESELLEIGPPCNRDDSEQLRLAREVLRKVLATEMDAIAAWAIKDAFDKSGVRL